MSKEIFVFGPGLVKECNICGCYVTDGWSVCMECEKYVPIAQKIMAKEKERRFEEAEEIHGRMC